MDGRPRIYINGRFLTQRITGIQRYSREVLNALDQEICVRPELKRFEWVLVTPPKAIIPNVKAISVDVLNGLNGNLWEQISLYRKTRSGTLVSFGSTGPLLHRRQLITIHDASVYRVADAFNWRFNLWYKFLIPRIIRQSKTLLAVSEFAKGESIKFYGASDAKVSVTREGWQHLDRIHASSNGEIASLVGNRPFVLAVSSPTPNKNFGVVVEAMEMMGKTPFDFVVAGSIDPAVFSKVPRALKRTKYLGYVTDEQLKGLYRSALCFVFPSRYEGFGIPPLEAMAMGCPVIASDIAAVKEVCGDAVRYFDPSCADQLAKELLAFARNGKLKTEYGIRGIARSKMFSWQDTASRIADHLLENYR